MIYFATREPGVPPCLALLARLESREQRTADSGVSSYTDPRAITPNLVDLVQSQ